MFLRGRAFFRLKLKQSFAKAPCRAATKGLDSKTGTKIAEDPEMKKYIAALAGLALSLSACQDLQEKDFMKTKALTLTASVEQPVGTRTLIAGDSQVWWEKGDEIKVFAGT